MDRKTDWAVPAGSNSPPMLVAIMVFYAEEEEGMYVDTFHSVCVFFFSSSSKLNDGWDVGMRK